MSQPAPREYQIECRMTFEPAALERVCQVVRIRGFEVTEVNASLQDTGWRIALTVRGSRSLDMLRKQLEKLHNVERVVADTTQRITQRSA
ncbi:ACT domain-containing protein [Marinobacter sp. SS21]|uniref:ACT domain-containing protein n=1 Tax=Marinobacter sp. SS21 TaxID=2979460 RepID=UPI00232ADE55|nr:ACT domain-containing protein [Marinobacter sp. SS21]MDC0662751.1 ACT domain-containing protein [Marinobacter sp. SS21]